MLHLRRENDVAILEAAPWWTFGRLLLVLLAVAAISGVALIWALVMSRKNNMLHHAQTALKQANDELELRVEERTQELKDQVEAKEKARAELALTQRRLIAASRQAGMAEVATGVLHNVGNVLNSVNVSTTLISERLRNSRIELVSKCAGLLKKPAQELVHFLTEDPRGKTLPGYLEQLGHNLEQDRTFLRTEMDSLAKNIEHIKVIVSMQQSHAKSGGVLEEVEPKDLLDDAIQIQSAGLERHGIRVVLDCERVPRLLVDRHKVLQILINLISNAKWALEHRESGRELKCSLHQINGSRVQFAVEDNGIGIAPENLNRIFTQGFSTRKGGHGFGLHSGANSARELGGSLTVHSEGPGHGARFVLELPIDPEKNSASEDASIATAAA
jgi:Signal transduction histidine kinase regulating C4-dicarboxylate transport system